MSDRQQLTKKECIEHINEVLEFIEDLSNGYSAKVNLSWKLWDIREYIKALPIAEDKQVRLIDLEDQLARLRDELNKILGE